MDLRLRLHKVVTACKNCVILGKEEKAMFRAHSDACLTRSHVNQKLVEALLNGELSEDPALKKHVYCVLVKCKIVGKDGKLLKSAVLGKLGVRADGKSASKVRQISYTVFIENIHRESGRYKEMTSLNGFDEPWLRATSIFYMVLENCAKQSPESAISPVEDAWNLFRCGYDRKAVLFDYMPTGTESHEQSVV
ncbi:B2 protein [Operophtera brumata]|uniref:B2 protein n=1 Tax=Operophtera brumata TaxID=104452 RepID=A0A0L7LIU9_OPEBR|nr:B2 protein [Operophtera brumata]